jgi:hypothetical protein
MRGSSGQSSEERRLGRPLHAVAAVTALLAFLAFSGSALASSAPTIESESVSGQTEHDATLEAQINTGGVATHYQLHLEYGCGISGEFCAQFCVVPGPCPGPANGPVDIPLPSGDLPGSSQVEHVSLDLHEVGVTLEPATKYRYSIEATNTGGTAEGPGQFFTTPPGGTVGAAPSEVVTEAAEATSTGYKLKGKLNPESSPTTYYFIYKQAGAVECEDLEGCGPETMHGGPLTGDTQQEVSPAEVTGLEPDKTYIYWLIARNAHGTAVGRQLTFTTPPAEKAPVIDSVSLSHLTSSDATLEAQINTEGLETTYEFQLLHHLCPPGTEPLGCKAMIQKVPLPSGRLLGSFVSQSVSLDLNSVGVTLYPDAEYDYRVVVTSAAGKAEGSSQTFVTPEDGVQPFSTSTATSPPSGGNQSGTSSTPAGSGGSSSTPGVTPLVSPLQKTVEPKALTKAQKLSKALKQCKKEQKRKRAACEKQAHQKYVSVAKKSKSK